MFKNTSLKWRIAALTTMLLLLFASVLATVAIAAVNRGLSDELQSQLLKLALVAQQMFDNPKPGQPTFQNQKELIENVDISVFGFDGTLLGGQKLNIPSSELALAQKQDVFWQGERNGSPLRAVLHPIPKKLILVVSSDNSIFIKTARALTNTILLTTAVLAVLAMLAGYWVAQISLRPLKDVANQAAKLDEGNLIPLSYDGPRDELGLLTVTLNHLVARLKRAFDAQRSFLAESSHELRTPLTALEGYLRRATHEADEAHQPVLQDAQRVAQSMTRLVSDLLQLSRGEVVKEWIPHVVDLDEISDAVVREFPGVQADTPSQPVEVVGDPERLMQLLRNLISNAVRAAGKPEGVQVVLRQLGEEVELSVQDNGPGIAPEIKQKIFEKFFKGPGGGSGLGLAIVAQIVRVHSGRIEIQSAPGQGAKFSVYLPALLEEPV